MKHPPYHLRPNKAVDRFMLIEAIKKLESLKHIGSMSKYTYYGFGGPYLEEFRLLYEFCPEVRMVSIEEDADTFKRQKFHLPCGTLCLKKAKFKSFLALYDPKDELSIFWLDYTRLDFGVFEDFQMMLQKVSANSVVKVTLRAEPSDYFDKADEFRTQFGGVMPITAANPPRKFEPFAGLLQDMLQIAAQRTLPSAFEMTFQPLSSFCYADGVGMFTLTGIVCQRTERKAVREHFRNWPFANLNWNRPKRIDVPFLSTKERLHLQRHLPCTRNAGQRLLKTLGYAIDADKRKSASKLKQYADFHRYFPHFVKAIP